MWLIGVKFDKITKAPLEGDRTIERGAFVYPTPNSFFSRLNVTISVSLPDYCDYLLSIELQTLRKPQSQPRMNL